MRSFLPVWRAAFVRCLSRTLGTGALVLFVATCFPGHAAAQTITGCSATPLMANATLAGNITASNTDPTPCLTVGADNVMVNLAGYTLDVSALGNNAIAIETGTTSNTGILGGGGKIVTAYSGNPTSPSEAIDTQGGNNTTITNVTFWNVTSSCTPGDSNSTNQRNLNFGTAIRMTNVTGASISANDIECYRTGIVVSGSDVPRKGTGMISGNTLINETYNNVAANTSITSAALILDSSSGWTIQMNNVTYSGSPDGSYGCGSSATGCTAAIELTGTSNGNSVINNSQVTLNFGPGIGTGPLTYRNKIQQNYAPYNAVADLWDEVPPHSSNNWNKNTCQSELGSVSPQKCP